MDSKLLRNTLKDLESLVRPDKDLLIDIIDHTRCLFEQEDTIIYTDGKYNVVGDLHGQFFDFLKMLDLIGQGEKIIFLGDYVDRGYNSVELMIYLLIMKLIDTDKIIMLRGNHENRSQTAVYGFEEECLLKYDRYVYWKFCELFEYLPMITIVNQKYFCVHGGISPDLTLEWLKSQDRVQEYSEISTILWGDPVDSIEMFEESQRGAGFLYGRKAVKKFLENVGCEYLVRSHQLVSDGYEEKFDGRCITVWSAPNYCYRCKNIASFMVIDNEAHKYVLFEAASEQYRV